MTRIKFTRIQGGEALRTPTVTGTTDHVPPAVGERLEIWAAPLEGGILRNITTSPVARVSRPAALGGRETYFIDTESGSRYFIEVLSS